MKIGDILITPEQIETRVKALAAEISRDYQTVEQPLIFVGMLKGAFIFMADLVRHITVPTQMDFLILSSYGDATKSSGVVRMLYDLQVDIVNRDVILVEDIVDTGLTLHYISRELELRSPKTLKICSLLSKDECRKIDIEPDYVGFSVPDRFVVGYGLDYAQQYRNLPYIGVLEED
ncbi:MAG: hypoxanthine phosphoribosyltransferase [Gemmatimonadetes bacterium]|nr:MAG: hypoxanthine phosphoribosyltransferase [Gemmatimonadota bacterium]